MREVRPYGPGNAPVGAEPPPLSGPDRETASVTAVGLCGADLCGYTEGSIGDATLTDPLVLGHEIADAIKVVVDPRT